MDERVIKFRVGVVVVAAVIITIILVMLFGAWPTVLQSQYALHIKFPEAPGIAVDTPVRKSGVLVGRVSEVKLLEEGGVLVSLNVNDKYRLRRNEVCRISTGSLIGDAVLEFVPAGQAQLIDRFDADGNGILDPEEIDYANQRVADGDFMSEGIVASNPMQVLVNLEDTIESAFVSVSQAGDEVSQLVRSVNETMGDDQGQLRRIMQKTEVALERFDTTMQSLQTVLGDEELVARIKASLNEMPELVHTSRQTMEQAGSAIESIQRAAAKAEERLDDIAGLTEPFRDNGPEMSDHILNITRNLEDITADLQVFTDAMNSQQSTIGRLVYDDTLYHKIDGIVSNAEELSRRLGPIVNDVRIFTDKIARDPRQLGVKGALDKRPTGLKTGVLQ